MLQVGDKAPEILGTDEMGNEVKLSDYSGRRLVLYFYPKDSTPGCTAEACSLRDGMERLLSEGYAVVGVSADSAKSHERFKEKQQLNFPLIADVDKKLIEAFGVCTTFVIDSTGVVERVITKVDTKNAAKQILGE